MQNVRESSSLISAAGLNHVLIVVDNDIFCIYIFNIFSTLKGGRKAVFSIGLELNEPYSIGLTVPHQRFLNQSFVLS